MTVGAPDPVVLRGLLDRLSIERADLARLAGYGPDVVLDDIDRLKSVKYSFVIAIEVCIDICHHVIAATGIRAPDTFADAFRALAENGYLPGDLTDSLADMAGFRNLLVHGYGRVDDRQVVRILRTRLGDIDAFSRQAAGWVTGLP